MIQKSFPIVLIIILTIASSCIPRRYGNFINATNGTIGLRVGASATSKQSRIIPPSTRQRFYLPSVDYVMVNVSNEDGMLFQAKIELTPDDPQFLHGKLLNFRTFLVTENGVFPVRAVFVEDWQKHKAKITNLE